MFTNVYFSNWKNFINLPVNTISYKLYEKNIIEKIKTQKDCKHVFSKPKILATSHDGKSEKIVEQCSICGYKKGYEKRY
jgi:hypothetical protein